MDERRKANRIEASLGCNVAGEGADFEATLINVSKMGAALRAESAQARVGESLTLLIDATGGLDEQALACTVVRADEREGGAIYGVTFDPLPPDAEDKLDQLLVWLASQAGTGSRKDPRVSARLKVRCQTREAFTATLENLSCGGLAVRCQQPVAPGDAMVVEFLVKDLTSGLEVRGTALRCELQADGAFKIAVRFSPPSQADRARIHEAVLKLLGAEPTAT